MKKALLALATAAGLLATGVASAADKINVALLRLSSSGPLFIAKEKGYFAEQGLDADFTFFDAASKVPVAVVSGDADFGVTGLTAGFYNLAGKGALKIVGAQSREEPGYNLNAYVVTPEAYEAGFRKPEDMKGRSIGISTVGSTFHYTVGALADKKGFDLKDVRLVPLQSLGNMATALTGKQVDGVVITANAAAKLEAEGAGKVIGWVADETPWQVGALFTSTRNVQERPELVERFIKAYQKGAADYHDAFLAKGPDGKVAKGENYDEMLGILSQYTQQPPEQVASALPYIDPQGRLDIGNIHDQVAWWQKQGQVDQSVKAGELIDPSFIEGHFNQPK